MSKDKQEENNADYARAYDEARNGDIIQDAMGAFDFLNEQERNGRNAGVEDRYKYGKKDE
jgi:hypothetical protein